LPLGQPLHTAWRLSEVVPAGHAAQTLAPADEYLPAAHAAQALMLLWPVRALAVPAGQVSSQKGRARAAEGPYVPAAHPAQLSSEGLPT